MSMIPQSVGGHMGDDARVAILPRKAKVTKVRQGQSIAGGEAAQWVADLECTDGTTVPNAMILGPRVPLVHTEEVQSWGMVGFFGGNVLDPYFIPAPWTSEHQHDVESHVLLDRFGPMTFHLIPGGVYTIKIPAPPGEAQERLLQIVAPSHPDGPSFQMLGGARRIARGGGVGDGADTRGDYVVIDATCAPAFIAWVEAVSAALNGIQATLQGLIAGQAALAAQTAAIAAWGLTVAPPLPGPFPPAPAAPEPPPDAPDLPVDPIPDVEGSGNLPAGGAVQIAGQIVTASSTVRGR